jgi:Protein of unknown function (DUF2726)
MQQALPWIIALAVLVVIAAGMAFWVTRPRQTASLPLPTEWPLSPRAVFSVDERRAYRQLRDAFPQYIVLSKLPLVRFCQPADVNEVQYWFDLLGGTHVSFAVCSAHGRVLIAIDLDGERPPSRRTQQMKQSVLSACRIRYLRCAIDHLPSMAELQMLLPQNPAAAAPAPMAAAPVAQPAGAAPMAAQAAAMPAPRPAAGASAAPAPMPQQPAPAPRAAAPRPAPAPAQPQIVRDVAPEPKKARKDRKALWQDSGLFQDSFFGIDNLRDAGPSTGFGSLLSDSPRGRSDPNANVLESARQGPVNRR